MSSSAEPVIDANLAVALDALLTEQSVTRPLPACTRRRPP